MRLLMMDIGIIRERVQIYKFRKFKEDNWIGKNKFITFNSAIRINPDKMFDIMNDNFITHWILGNYGTLDELIAPSSLNHPCVQIVETKPHSKGIWITSLGEKTHTGKNFIGYLSFKGQQYILKLFPRTMKCLHLDTGDIVDSVLKLYGEKQCNITADNFYCNQKTRPLFRSNINHTYTLSVKNNDSEYPWTYIRKDVEKEGDFAVFQNRDSGELAMSCLFETKFKNIVTNHFKIKNSKNISNENTIKEFYYNFFNTIDLANRNFYDILYSGKRNTIDQVSTMKKNIKIIFI